MPLVLLFLLFFHPPLFPILCPTLGQGPICDQLCGLQVKLYSGAWRSGSFIWHTCHHFLIVPASFSLSTYGFSTLSYLHIFWAVLWNISLEWLKLWWHIIWESETFDSGINSDMYSFTYTHACLICAFRSKTSDTYPHALPSTECFRMGITPSWSRRMFYCSLTVLP